MWHRHLRNISLLFIVFLSACESKQQTAPSKLEEAQTIAVPDRPIKPWVFRSVLDNRSRILTAGLHENLFVAYDTTTAALYKAWDGTVKLEAAVYTGKHGPQPTSIGSTYLLGDKENGWSLYINGKSTANKIRYRGHRISKGQFSLLYEIKINEADTVSIVETPEYSKDHRANVKLLRRFEVSGLPSNAYLEQRSTLLNQQDNEWLVKLDKDGSHSFERTFALLPSQINEVEKTEKTAKNRAQKLIENSDCGACHNETLKTVGPSYLAIAERYFERTAAKNLLIKKIIDGGSGAWGNIPMTPHKSMPEEDASEIVDYILALANKPANKKTNNIVGKKLNIASIPLILSEENLSYAGDVKVIKKGLAINVYDINRYDMKKGRPDYAPTFSGAVSKIHAWDKKDLGQKQEFVYMELKGTITPPQKGQYLLRIIADDKADLILDGKKINSQPLTRKYTDLEIELGENPLSFQLNFIQYKNNGRLSLQWKPPGAEKFSLIDDRYLKHNGKHLRKLLPYVPIEKLVKSIPGDGIRLNRPHPAFDLSQFRPDDFEARVGGMDQLSDGRIVISTWDKAGGVYIIENRAGEFKVKEIASGLAEPLGLKVVNDKIYVMQKQELTELIDLDGDEIIDEYKALSYDWEVSTNFHEFSFGLDYKDGFFYAALASAVDPGGKSSQPQVKDRGKAIKISEHDGTVEFIASGLRTPNGVKLDSKGHLWISDNQGDWLPANKLIRIKPGAFYGMRAVELDAVNHLKDEPPTLWLPTSTVRSPSQAIEWNVGPYQDQMLFGEITLGGIRRAFFETVNGKLQGGFVRFSQGFESSVNRLLWDEKNQDLYVGGIGVKGNWIDSGKLQYGLQKLHYNGQNPFEILKVNSKTNGLLIEFTQAIDELADISPRAFEIKHWYYQPTENYGGPELGKSSLAVKSISIDQDRKKLFLEIPELIPERVVHVKITNPFVSSNQNSLLSTEAWLTLNELASNDNYSVDAVSGIQVNTLSSIENQNGWQLLFNGKNKDGWHCFDKKQKCSNWSISNGNLFFNPPKRRKKNKERQDLIFDNEFENYELKLEWKISRAGNSGIFYGVKEEFDLARPWQTGFEMQILDNQYHADGRIEAHRSGDLYDLISSEFNAANSAQKWNRVHLIVNKGKVEHWLNGYKTLEFDMYSDEFKKLIKQSKFSKYKNFAQAGKGRIGLQDHNNQVWFRNIKLKNLN